MYFLFYLHYYMQSRLALSQGRKTRKKKVKKSWGRLKGKHGKGTSLSCHYNRFLVISTSATATSTLVTAAAVDIFRLGRSASNKNAKWKYKRQREMRNV